MKPHQSPRRALRHCYALIAPSFIAALTACSAGQDENRDARPARQPAHSTIPKGETVPGLGGTLCVHCTQSRLHERGGDGKCIFNIFQDKNNNYWFAGAGPGVYRFDGKTITHFTTKNGLCDNGIGGIQEDKSGNIYFATGGGICKFNGQTFGALTLSERDSSDDAWKLQSDDLWFAGPQNSGAVFRYDGQSLNRLKFPKTKAGEDSKYPNMTFSPYDVYTIFKDSKGNMWFGTNMGVCRYDGQSFAWIYEDELGFDEEGQAFNVRSIIEDKDGKFLFTNTVNRFDVYRSKSADKGTLNYKKESGVGNHSDDFSYFMSAIKDKNGELWMATYGAGVWRYDGKTMTNYPVRAGNTPVAVFSIYKDNRGDLWLGTHEHGVYKFNGKAFESFRP